MTAAGKMPGLLPSLVRQTLMRPALRSLEVDQNPPRQPLSTASPQSMP